MESYTLEQFIAEGDFKIKNTYQDFSMIDIGNVLSHNILNDYFNEIMSMTKVLTLTDKEYHRYCFRPRLLANDIYGDGELFFIILYVNGICNVKDFNRKKIKMLSKGDLSQIISRVKINETNPIIRNRQKIKEYSE